LESVPFHFRWDLVEWNPKLNENPVDFGVNLDESVVIYDEMEEEQHEVFGPQIKLDLGTGSSIHDLGESPVKAVEEEHAVEVIGVETSEEKPNEEMGTGDSPILRVGEGDSFFGDYPGDDFEKVGEINLEETPQTPSEPVLSVPSEETPSSAKPRRKRIKTLAGRRSTLGPEADSPTVPNLSILSLILSQTAYPTNPQFSPFSCSRVCKKEQLHKTGISGD